MKKHKISLKSEAIQCLHQVSVFRFGKILLLIGNTYGTIIKRIWMHFTESIRVDRLSTLKICYNLSIKWTCKDQPRLKSLYALAKTWLIQPRRNYD